MPRLALRLGHPCTYDLERGSSCAAVLTSQSQSNWSKPSGHSDNSSIRFHGLRIISLFCSVLPWRC